MALKRYIRGRRAEFGQSGIKIGTIVDGQVEVDAEMAMRDDGGRWREEQMVASEYEGEMKSENRSLASSESAMKSRAKLANPDFPNSPNPLLPTARAGFVGDLGLRPESANQRALGKFLVDFSQHG